MRQKTTGENGRCGVQVKICGITTPQDARACAEAGADALGCVFYPKSPRNVEADRARIICEEAAGVPVIGVFVDKTYDQIMGIVERCGLSGVQLHGNEPPGLVDALAKNGLVVIKALFVKRAPGIDRAAIYGSASALLVECGMGKLPGGNAEAWNWAGARSAAEFAPLVLAGGLSPENIAEAIGEAMPDAVDVSSAVESSPGKKDMARVSAFIEAVYQASKKYSKPPRRVFP